MKFLLLAIVLFASAVSAAEAPDSAEVQILKLQISNIEKDMRTLELSFELAKAQREKLIAELQKKQPSPEVKK